MSLKEVAAKLAGESAYWTIRANAALMEGDKALAFVYGSFSLGIAELRLKVLREALAGKCR